MSAFARIRPAGFEQGSFLTHDEMTQLDLNVSKALNAVDGGEWHPTAPIKIGGAGLAILSDAVWGDGAEARFEDGATAQFDVGALLSLGTPEEFLPDTRAVLSVGESGEMWVTRRGEINVVASGTSTHPGGRILVTGNNAIAEGDVRQPLIAAMNRGVISASGGGYFAVASGGALRVGLGGTLELNAGGTYALKDKLVTSGAGKVTKRYHELTLTADAPSPVEIVDTTNVDVLVIKYNDVTSRAWTVTLDGDSARDPGDELVVIVRRLVSDTGAKVTVSGAFNWEMLDHGTAGAVRSIRLQKLDSVVGWVNTTGVVIAGDDP